MPSTTAMEVDPDGLLYFPVMGANQIWRIDPEGGQPEPVASELGVPDAVKFDSAGRIVSTQMHTGQVLRIDPRTVLPGGLNWPLDLAVGDDGNLYIADGAFSTSWLRPARCIRSGCYYVRAFCAELPPRVWASSWSPRPAGKCRATGH